MLFQQLESIGLTDKEAKLYVAILELGKATAFDLAQKAGINRGTAYSVLDGLIKKGLVVERDKEGVTDYVSAGPQSLTDYIEAEKNSAELKMKNLRNFLPEIINLNSLTSSKTQVKFFSGMEGIEYIRREFDKFYQNHRDAEFINVFPVIAWKRFPVSPKDHRQKYRAKCNLKSLVIYDPKEGVPKKRPHFKGSEMRLISQNILPITCETLIYDDWFSIHDYTEELNGVIIKHPEMVKTFRAWFKLAWDAAEKYMHFSQKD